MDWNLISIIAFYSIIAILLVKYRKKITVQHKIFLLIKTKVGIKIIDKIARFKTFWKYWGYAAVPVGFIGMAGVMALLVWSLIKIIQEPAAAAGVSLVLPGVRIPGASIFLPFWYGIIAIVVLIVVHEGCHGIVARAHDIKLKSTGVGLLIALPLAFVEPDEKQMNKKPLSTRLSVFAAGPFANFCTGIIVLLLSVLVVAPAMASVTDMNGVYVTGVVEDMPTDLAGIGEGDIISSINGESVSTSAEFVDKMTNVKPGDTVIIGTQRGDIPVKTISRPEDASKPYIGVNFKQSMDIKASVKEKYGKLPWVLFYLSQAMYWIFLLNIGVGLINLLPLGPFVGGKIKNATLLSKLKNKRAALKLMSFISIFSLILLVLNVIGPIF